MNARIGMKLQDNSITQSLQPILISNQHFWLSSLGLILPIQRILYACVPTSWNKANTCYVGSCAHHIMPMLNHHSSGLDSSHESGFLHKHHKDIFRWLWTYMHPTVYAHNSDFILDLVWYFDTHWSCLYPSEWDNYWPTTHWTHLNDTDLMIKCSWICSTTHLPLINSLMPSDAYFGPDNGFPPGWHESNINADILLNESFGTKFYEIVI